MLGRIWRLLIGPVLSTRRVRHERLPVLLALPVFASDALSSSAYATEEMMLVLWSAGEEVLRLAFPISLAVVALLFIVVFSYRQTVYAYPQGGGAQVGGASCADAFTRLPLPSGGDGRAAGGAVPYRTARAQ